MGIKIKQAMYGATLVVAIASTVARNLNARAAR